MSIDLKLPQTQVPVFPDACVSCGLPSASDVVQFATGDRGFWPLSIFLAKRFQVEVPVCSLCRAAVLRDRRIGGFVTVTLGLAGIGAGVALGFWLQANRLLVKLMGVGGLLLFLAPVLIWKLAWPPAFEFDDSGDELSYQFRDPGFARDFARLNDLPWAEAESNEAPAS